MTLTVTVFGRQVLAVHIGRTQPATPPPERRPVGFGPGASLRTELGPRRWPDITATTQEDR